MSSPLLFSRIVFEENPDPLYLTLQTQTVSQFEKAGITGTTLPIMIPGDCSIITVALVNVLEGSAKIQASISSYNEVVDGDGIWTDWDYGTVSSTTQAFCMPPTALRVVVSSGSWTVSMRAQ